MITRRDMTTGFGLMAAASLVSARAGAQVAYADVPKGPWTESGMIRRAGGSLHYAKIGTAERYRPPVVLLHKLGGWMADWRHVAPLLAKGRQIIAFDLPGHGDSRMVGDPPYIQTLGETAAMLVGAFDEMGLDKIDLVGTSLGGCVGTSLAAFYPERVHRLALVSSALTPARSLATIAEKLDGPQKAIFDANGAPLPNDAKLLSTVFGIVNYEQISAEGNSSRRQAGRWIQCQERGVAITDIVANLARIEAQTLLLYGALDPDYVKFRATAETALKRSRTAFVPNAGAFVMQDNPPATAAILADFLEQG
jgi:pimeloyl-ACP methyl ester carboxylesterase